MIDLVHDVDRRTISDLERLSAGARQWISRNLEYLQPSNQALRDTAKVKASLELALLCRVWTRLHPGDPELAAPAATVREIWQDPGFPQRMAATPKYFRIHALNYLALAPAQLADGHHHALREELAPGGHFPLYGKSAHVRLEARYFAELAGLQHDFPSCQQLYAESRLAGWTETASIDPAQAYVLTHILFHLSDFGTRDPGLEEGERRRVSAIIDGLTGYLVKLGHWDLMAEFMLAQRIIGDDPTRTRSGAAAIRKLARAQLPSGAIRGGYAGQQPSGSAPAGEFFWRAYHTTLAAAMASMIVLSRGPS